MPLSDFPSLVRSINGTHTTQIEYNQQYSSRRLPRTCSPGTALKTVSESIASASYMENHDVVINQRSGKVSYVYCVHEDDVKRRIPVTVHDKHGFDFYFCYMLRSILGITDPEFCGFTYSVNDEVVVETGIHQPTKRQETKHFILRDNRATANLSLFIDMLDTPLIRIRLFSLLLFRAILSISELLTLDMIHLGDKDARLTSGGDRGVGLLSTKEVLQLNHELVEKCKPRSREELELLPPWCYWLFKKICSDKSGRSSS